MPNKKENYIIRESLEAVFAFSTSGNEMNFNKELEEGKKNLNNILYGFKLNDVGYLNQIHSNKVFIYDGKIHDGDAIITDKKNVAIGVFTADCVPVFLFDKVNKVIAAVHSGWRGTLDCIVTNTLLTMKSEYNTDYNNIIAYIGPHIRKCCYEVGYEVIELFQKSKKYSSIKFNNRMLNLEECIIKQLSDIGVNDSNIKTINECTFCSNAYKFYSYRRQNGTCGRMFSFVFIR